MKYEFEYEELLFENGKLKEKIQDLEAKNRELKTDYDTLKREFEKSVDSQFFMG